MNSGRAGKKVRHRKGVCTIPEIRSRTICGELHALSVRNQEGRSKSWLFTFLSNHTLWPFTYLQNKESMQEGMLGQEEIRGTSTELVSPNAKMGRCVTRPQEV